MHNISLLRRAGARPTNDISIEFEILPKFAGLWFKMHSANHNEMLHKSRQLHCRDVCNISLWSVMYILNWTTPNFGRISNSIEISLVGRAPGQVTREDMGKTNRYKVATRRFESLIVHSIWGGVFVSTCLILKYVTWCTF